MLVDDPATPFSFSKFSLPPKMATYTLWCLIEGDKSVFEVTIPVDSNIYHLQEKIKQATYHQLEKFPTKDLTLWKVCYF
jgi:hypothetical protein